MKGMRLKPEWQIIAAEFEELYGDRGCTCFVSPPCSYCTHPGNPSCLEETEDAWENALIGAVRDVVESRK